MTRKLVVMSSKVVVMTSEVIYNVLHVGEHRGLASWNCGVPGKLTFEWMPRRLLVMARLIWLPRPSLRREPPSGKGIVLYV